MGSDDFVILRIDQSPASVFGGAAALGMDDVAAADDVTVEMKTLGSGEIAEVSREPGVLGAAQRNPGC